MNGRAVLAHCWTGGPRAGWYPAWRAELAEHGWRTEVPALPEPNSPHPGAWLAAFRAAVREPDEQTVLVGHSLGCATLLAYLQDLPARLVIGGVVLIAPFSQSLNIPAIDEFHAQGFDWNRLRARPEAKRVIFGARDSYLADRLWDECRHFSTAFGADVLLLAHGDHFSPASGCTRLPQAARLVRECLDASGAANGNH